jgi:hypothetical protein
MGPEWAKKCEIFYLSGVGKNLKFFMGPSGQKNLKFLMRPGWAKNLKFLLFFPPFQK